jgi:hypothetical protein
VAELALDQGQRDPLVQQLDGVRDREPSTDTLSLVGLQFGQVLANVTPEASRDRRPTLAPRCRGCARKRSGD